MSACGFSSFSNEPEVLSHEAPSVEIVEKIEVLQKSIKSSAVRLVQSRITPKTFKIKILIDNPEKQEINSARTWLAYNPQFLKVININDNESDFDLFAPGENNDDIENGLIKIGRSRT